jgi:hypothetical protein
MIFHDMHMNLIMTCKAVNSNITLYAHHGNTCDIALYVYTILLITVLRMFRVHAFRKSYRKGVTYTGHTLVTTPLR